MTRDEWLRKIYVSGKDIYTITTDKPRQLSENLRRGARLRGWKKWKFSVLENQVIVKVKQNDAAL